MNEHKMKICEMNLYYVVYSQFTPFNDEVYTLQKHELGTCNNVNLEIGKNNIIRLRLEVELKDSKLYGAWICLMYKADEKGLVKLFINTWKEKVKYSSTQLSAESYLIQDDALEFNVFLEEDQWTI